MKNLFAKLLAGYLDETRVTQALRSNLNIGNRLNRGNFILFVLRMIQRSRSMNTVHAFQWSHYECDRKKFLKSSNQNFCSILQISQCKTNVNQCVTKVKTRVWLPDHGNRRHQFARGAEVFVTLKTLSRHRRLRTKFEMKNLELDRQIITQLSPSHYQLSLPDLIQCSNFE